MLIFKIILFKVLHKSSDINFRVKIGNQVASHTQMPCHHNYGEIKNFIFQFNIE